MTRYSRPADALNPPLDLSEYQAFHLDTGDGNGPCSYPANWFALASPAEIVARGFVAYKPVVPVPQARTPEMTPLTRVQLHLALYMPQVAGGIGFSEAEIAAFIAALPAGQREAAAIRLAQSDSFSWDHPFIKALLPAVQAAKGLSEDQVRAAWMQASAL